MPAGTPKTPLCVVRTEPKPLAQRITELLAQVTDQADFALIDPAVTEAKRRSGFYNGLSAPL